MGLERSLPAYELNYRAGGKSYMDRRFVLEMAGSLSGTNLEEGDTLPEDATYRIITAKIVREAKTGLARFIDVTAEKQTTSRTLLTQFSREEQRGGVILYHRTYQIALASSLSTNSLEEGDGLPADATAEIVQSAITVGGKSNLANMVHVTARKYGEWAD